MNKETGRLQWVDSLRGIAAILVAILHLWLLMKNNIGQLDKTTSKCVSFFISDFIDLGKIGVVVFFLVSGFVIPFSLYKVSSKKFAIGRFFRLYPAYWVSIIFFCLIVGVPNSKILLSNITMLQKFWGTEDLIGVYWTLQIELIFYFICIVLSKFKLLNNDRFLIVFFYLMLIITIIMAFFRYRLDEKLPVALPLGIAVMFLGMLWRKNTIENSKYVQNRKLYGLVILFILSLIPITLLAYTKDYGFNETWYRYFISYTIALILFIGFSVYKPVNKILTYLGSISYSLYLLHPIFGMSLPFKFFSVNYLGTHKFLFIVTFFVFSLVAATLSYYLIEKPLISIGKKLTSRRIKQSEIDVI